MSDPTDAEEAFHAADMLRHERDDDYTTAAYNRTIEEDEEDSDEQEGQPPIVDGTTAS